MDYTVIAVLFNFLLLATVLFKVSKKPLAEFLVRRRNEVSDMIREAEKLALESEKRLKSAQNAFSEKEAIIEQQKKEASSRLAVLKADSEKRLKQDLERLARETKMIQVTNLNRKKEKIQEFVFSQAVEAVILYFKKFPSRELDKRWLSEFVLGTAVKKEA